MSLRRFIPSSSGAYLVLAILLLPMFFIGIRDTHDWGDDFAIYIQGAQNLIHHKPVSETKYISFENYNPKYPPAAVPVGFPLILSPVVHYFGVNFKALNYYMTLWLYLCAFMVFTFLLRYLSVFSSLCLTLIFFLNPFMIAFKSEIISDLPFAFFSTLALYLYLDRQREANFFRQLFLGLVVALLISIRSIGWCTFICFCIDLFLRTISLLYQRESLSAVINFLRSRVLWVVSFIAGYSLLTIIAGHSAGSSLSFYTSSYQGIHVWEVLMTNLNIYIQNFQSMFDHDAGIYSFGILITRAAMLFCFVIGFIYFLFKGYDMLMLCFLLYAAAVLLSPFNTQGFRLFFPVYAIIILFIAYGARSISVTTFSKRYIWAPLLTLLILLQYRADLQSMRDHQSDPIYPTPISAECKAGFDKINKLTSDKDLILSTKPRACAFFAERHFCVIPDGGDVAAKTARLSISKPNLILVIKEIDEDRLESIARFEKDSAVYQDSKFKLYRRSL